MSQLINPTAPRLSIVMSTFNRGGLLEEAVRSVLSQAPGSPAFELIVVDNNSTDGTRAVVERFAAVDTRVRYLFEARQGLSFARNAGITAARAPYVAFTDDDVRVDPNWASAIVRSFDEHPEAQMIGGRVLPLWPAEPPAWLTRDHWTPLALADHGDASIVVNSSRAICLVGANLSCRRELFDTIGGFATDLQRVKDGIGSLEDHEFLLRLLRSEGTALYDPRIVVHAEIQLNRLTRDYHRRWHTGHGHFHALLRSEDVERSGLGTVLGVPAHLFRKAAVDAVGWVKAVVRRDRGRAFLHECALRFFKGFFVTRAREVLARLGSSRRRAVTQEHA